MATPENLGYGQRLIIDTSAFAAIARSRALNNTPPEWQDAILHKQLLLSPVVKLELLHSARSADEFESLDDWFGYFDPIPLTKGIFDAAMGAIRDLAKVSPKYHRVGTSDALIAASASLTPGVGVLHYNRKDFDRLREVLEFDNVALGPPGTFERGT